MARFNKKEWNDAVFQKYLRKVPNLRENSLLKSGVLRTNESLKARLVDGVGGNRLIEPIKDQAKAKFVNYDGKTDIETNSRDTFQQTKIVKGIAGGYEEKDFSTEISGETYLPDATEVGEDLANQNMDTLLSILKGIFSMSSTDAPNFVDKHTYETENKIDATTINLACQKAFGDKKKFVSMAFMHSMVATTLENLQILDYLKYTDSQGIQSNMMIAQQGNKLVIIDDDMPVESGYYTASADTPKALKVTAEGSGANEIKLTTVKASAFYPEGVKANDYVVAGEKYTTYLLGKGAFEYCDVGVQVPSEIVRDAIKDGGINKLIVRQRKLYAPEFISWKGATSIISPTNEQLATGSNWEVVNNGEAGLDKKFVNPKLIPFGRIITRG